MRYFAIALTACLAAACATTKTVSEDTATETTIEDVSSETLSEQDAKLSDYYATGWAVTGGWPGEYPAGFSILEENIVLEAHSRMHPLTPANVKCPVPQYATYQQWNIPRSQADNLNFQVATKIFNITITQDTTIEHPDNELAYRPKKLSLKTGDQLSYLRYLGEGFAIVEFEGKEYEIDEAGLHGVSDIDNSDNPDRNGEDLWLELTCADAKATRAWVLYDEVIRQDGVGPTPIIGYGESQDITQDDVQSIIEMMAINAEFGGH